MRRVLICLLVIASLATGCSFNVEVLTPAVSQPASQAVSDTPTLEPVSATPTQNISVLLSHFDEVRFAFNAVDDNGVSYFPSETIQVYAIWKYHGMRDGMVVQREWYLDGKLWLEREELWDFAKYGADGIVRDVSIYDFDAGLPSGMYQLRMFVDGTPQPIGYMLNGQRQNWANFEIQPVDALTSASSSPDNLWIISVYGMKRIVLRDNNGMPKEIFTGREINYLTWFGDSKHFLFVDRDYSGQQPGSPFGIRDDLYIADIAIRQVSLLNTVDSPYQGYGGPQPSLDGKYIAALIGSGFGDACFVDTRLIFFELASDFKSAKPIEQKSFIGVPSAADSVVYPLAEGSWWVGNQYLVTLNGTCGMDPSLLGAFVFDVPGLKANPQSTLATPLSVGDLGWGEVHGVVADAVTGNAIAGATVTCEHSSYTSQANCSGSQVTEIPGVFVFHQVFFHDTDRITLTVTATGYQPQEFRQNIFTTNDLTVNFALVRSH